MTKPTKIAAADIEIATEPAVVWNLMADMQRWSRWNPRVRWVSPDVDLVPGSTFIVGTQWGRINAEIQHVVWFHLLKWKIAFRGEHIEPTSSASRSRKKLRQPLAHLSSGRNNCGLDDSK